MPADLWPPPQSQFYTRDNFTGRTTGKSQNLNLVGGYALIDQISCTRHDSFGLATARPSQNQTVLGISRRSLFCWGFNSSIRVAKLIFTHHSVDRCSLTDHSYYSFELL